MLESAYQTELVKHIKFLFPGCFVLKMEKQGFPDLLILHKTRWAALEVKRSRRAPHQPNQEYYVELFDNLSFAAFIFPENEEEVLDALQSTLEPSRSTRILKR